jgi:hypothetical protein
MINPRTLPDGITPHKLERTIALQTEGGAVKSPHRVKLQNLRFSELSPEWCYINEVETMSDALDFSDDLDCFTIQMGAREILAFKYQ